MTLEQRLIAMTSEQRTQWLADRIEEIERAVRIGELSREDADEMIQGKRAWVDQLSAARPS